MTTGLVPHGVSPVTYGRHVMWARRRDKYGSAGRTTPARRPVEALTARQLLQKQRRKCGRGHLWTEANTRLSTIDPRSGKPRRYCRACDALHLAAQRERNALRTQLDQARRYLINIGTQAHRNTTSLALRQKLEAATARYQALKAKAESVQAA